MSQQNPIALLSSGDGLANPRRVPAAQSVTLRRSTSPSRSDKEKLDEKSSVDLSVASNVAAPSEVLVDTISKAKELQHGQAEVAKANANADAWFDESNKNTLGKGNVTFVDHDSPFYLPRDKSSAETDTYKKSPPEANNALISKPTHANSNQSWSDDYRSIIDDLTVENRELKQRLKKMEQMHSAHMQEDRLFEVYIHQLAPAKKRQLEAMLRDFAADVGPYDNVGDGQNSATMATTQPAPLLAKMSAHSSSTSKPSDSAYASMSASGAGASLKSHSNKDHVGPVRPSPTPQHTNQRVRSYVQDLPASLLPKGSFAISEESKKKLVVQKLEQLYLGRSDTSTAQSQLKQQQEVSQSAASADRKATEAKGQRHPVEGHRESRISKSRRKVRPSALSSSSTTGSTVSSSENSNSGASIEQRPTRPLDLDPAQAQDPKETIRYIKHLGFESPHVREELTPERTKGWVFLNLLMNMAQLHILNVTPDFVREALSELSTNFELSEDGHNIRWKGGSEPTKLVINETPRQEYTNESPSSELPLSNGHLSSGQSANPVGKSPVEVSNQGGPMTPHGLKRRGWPGMREREDSRYYSPMFFHGEESSYHNTTSNSLPLNTPGGKERTLSSESIKQSNGGRLSRGPAKLKSQLQKDAGTMIFYTAAKFYTDLSGDSFCMPSTIIYDKASDQAMGTAITLLEEYDHKGVLSLPSPSIESELESQKKLQDFSDLDGIEELSSGDDPGEKDLINLDVSGLHGLTPQDNFLVDVKINHTTKGSAISEVNKIELKPSRIPDPSYGTYYTSSGTDEAESESEDEENMDEYASADILASGIDADMYMPPIFRNVYSSTSTRRTMSSEETSSIDMLDYARKADPDIIAAREREFENNSVMIEKPEPRAAGSVAATVGDISNFLTSQEDVASVDGRVRNQQRNSGVKATLKRSINDVDGVEEGSPSKRQETPT